MPSDIAEVKSLISFLIFPYWDGERVGEREIDREGKRMKERYRQITDGNPSMKSDIAEVKSSISFLISQISPVKIQSLLSFFCGVS